MALVEAAMVDPSQNWEQQGTASLELLCLLLDRCSAASSRLSVFGLSWACGSDSGSDLDRPNSVGLPNPDCSSIPMHTSLVTSVLLVDGHTSCPWPLAMVVGIHDSGWLSACEAVCTQGISTEHCLPLSLKWGSKRSDLSNDVGEAPGRCIWVADRKVLALFGDAKTTISWQKPFVCVVFAAVLPMP